MIEMNLSTAHEGEPDVYSERLLEPLKQGRAMQMGRNTESAVELATWLAEYDVPAQVAVGTGRYTPTVRLPASLDRPSIVWPGQWVLLTPFGVSVYEESEWESRFFKGLFGQDPRHTPWTEQERIMEEN